MLFEMINDAWCDFKSIWNENHGTNQFNAMKKYFGYVTID